MNVHKKSDKNAFIHFRDTLYVRVQDMWLYSCRLRIVVNTAITCRW